MSKKSGVVVLLILFQTALAAIAMADPVSLGLNPRVLAWLSIVNVIVGMALNQLPALGTGRGGESDADDNA